ncbi:MAG TPA: C39 family peptidase [Longimicrobiales bacterium]|nr:C39 family peptidase [Longimicrobiales bacterium]
MLDVPYLPQSSLLCGGAAIAMVERWWGRRGVYAEDFADLVRPASGGILTTDLAPATRARGWDTQVLRGTPELARRSLADGVPVVALIQVAPERYHYVVVLGWGDGYVVFHDPATAPFKASDEDDFLARWAAAGSWALLVRPAAVAQVTASDDGLAADPMPASMPCPPWIDLALDAAADGRLDDASGLLAEAGRACPTEPLVLRETAGIRFKQGRDTDVGRLASEYLTLAPDDVYAWQLLAASRYRAGDRAGALEAWNRVGQPTVDLVRIDGVRTIRFREIAGAISAPPGTLLTPSRMALARRRLSDVPALRQSAVDYQPVPVGLAEVRASVVERPLMESAWRLAAAGAIRAVAQSEVGLEVANPTGGGEMWTGIWRWTPARPRGAIRLELPIDPRFQGILTIQGDWERFRFALDSAGPSIVEETRRSAIVGFGGWVTAGVRPLVAFRLERWSDDRHYVAGSIGAEVRARENRFELTARTEYAVALSAHPPYTTGWARASWASSLGLERAAWSARIGFDWAGRHAPLGTWPLAGKDLSWALPLRAHTLTTGGALSGRSAGRAITSAGLAADRPFVRKGPLVLGAGLFFDAAQIFAPADGSREDRFYLDGGGGLRIGLADGQLGVLRVDLSRGLVADRRTALTVGVHKSWPLFRQSYR